MRILHVVPTYLPATRYGGPIYAVHGLCRALAASGHEVSVATTTVDGDGDSAVPTGVPVELDGVNVWYFPATTRFLPRRLARRLYASDALRTMLVGSVPRFDVVHVHSVFLRPTAVAAAAAARHGVPYVISPRGMLVPELIRRRSVVAKVAWLLAVERHNLARAAAIHFTSELEAEDARRTRLPLPSPFVLPNGIDLPAPSPDEPREPYALFLGRVNWKKGIDRLIAAVQAVPEVRLVIAGNDEEALMPTLLDQARTAGIGDRVQFTGAVRGEQKDRLLRRATVLVLPSHSENFGNVVLEAMAHCTPVVVTSGVGMSEHVRRAGAGLVTSNEPAALAAAIGEIFRRPGTARQMGERGRRLVEQEFRWEAVAARMAAEYARITSAPSRRC